MKLLKLKLSLLSLLGLLSASVPFAALAAGTDVQLSTGTTLRVSVGGTNLDLTVAGGLVESLTVNAGNLELTLASGSVVSITSADKRTFDYGGDPDMTSSFTCNTGSSVLSLSGSGAAVVTVTPRTDICTVSSGGTSGGGGSYGGSTSVSSSVPSTSATTVSAPAPTVAVATTPTVVAAAPAVAQPSPVAQLASPVFNADLAIGTENADVKRLQELLATDPEVYPEGKATGYYGSLTRAAVVKFQLKHGVISNASDVGSGRIGPKTRAKLAEVFAAGVPTAPAVAQPSPVAAAVSPVFTNSLQKGARSDDVKRLQQLLATDSEIYPEGTTSGYYGTLTEKAVQKFQMKYGVVSSPSDAGYGSIGPKTRQKLQEVFGQGQSSAPAPAAPAVSAAEEAQRQALQQQLSDLQKQLNAMLKQAQQ